MTVKVILKAPKCVKVSDNLWQVCCQSEKPNLTWYSQEASSGSSQIMILPYNLLKEPMNSAQPHPTFTQSNLTRPIHTANF